MSQWATNDRRESDYTTLIEMRERKSETCTHIACLNVGHGDPIKCDVDVQIFLSSFIINNVDVIGGVG